MRRFADISLYLEALCHAFPLSWSHYVRLLSVEKPEARAFYETEALRGGWSVRQLDRQVSTLFYERTALAKNKAKLLTDGAKPRPGDAVSVEEEIKNPVVLATPDGKHAMGVFAPSQPQPNTTGPTYGIATGASFDGQRACVVWSTFQDDSGNVGQPFTPNNTHGQGKAFGEATGSGGNSSSFRGTLKISRSGSSIFVVTLTNSEVDHANSLSASPPVRILKGARVSGTLSAACNGDKR